ncbi:MAG: polyphosphate kinase 2 [Candidatus Accumulibacter sp.]|uniref:polyphosphate kinase 2 n=1 Tax=Accumulibacter sp. TaxID=2053492 RepID=UPI00287B3E62|nr:polyphosphate kinase 2 [Accumulibacter sp.]MDS4012750.1 polyphosphate kinase 2 [Accumulibacter sp.]
MSEEKPVSGDELPASQPASTASEAESPAPPPAAENAVPAKAAAKAAGKHTSAKGNGGSSGQNAPTKKAAGKAKAQGESKAKSDDNGKAASAEETTADASARNGSRKPALKLKFYEETLARLQIELVKLQEWIKFKKLKVVVLFEGRDAAGKGGTIKRITESLSPRVTRVVALPAPTDREQTQWYFQRYVQHLPAGGEMVLFDRSWYNRAGVERVMGFCTDEEYREFLRTCPEFERMLVRSGIILIKYWFSVSNEEQERRFQKRIFHPEKHWKLSPMDLESRARWVEYSKAKDAMFAHTDIKQAPWYVVDGDDKKRARLNVITHLLNMIDYEDLTPEPIVLPPRQSEHGYVRPPISDQTFIPEIY